MDLVRSSVLGIYKWDHKNNNKDTVYGNVWINNCLVSPPHHKIRTHLSRTFVFQKRGVKIHISIEACL